MSKFSSSGKKQGLFSTFVRWCVGKVFDSLSWLDRLVIVLLVVLGLLAVVS